MAKSIYETIKRQNGETFAQAIRQFDSGIFDIPNLPQLLKFAGRDATPILNFLESLKPRQLGASGFENKDAIELLSLAGYNAFYADTLEKQNAIQKYFAPGEELCTFKDEMRYKNFYIIHAVNPFIVQKSYIYKKLKDNGLKENTKYYA